MTRRDMYIDNLGKVLAGMVLGAVCMMLTKDSAAKGDQREFESLSTRKLVIVDETGAARIVLHSDGGESGLTILDTQGKARIRAGVASSGESTVSIHDASGVERAAIASGSLVDGVALSPTVRVSDQNGRIRAGIYSGIANSGFNIYGNDGAELCEISSSPSDSMTICLRSQRNQRIFQVSTNGENTLATISLFHMANTKNANEEALESVRIWTLPSGDGELILNGRDGSQRTVNSKR